jgi:hexosaminidase
MIKKGDAAIHSVIPAPLQFDVDSGCKFIFRSGMAVAFTDTRVASIAERFCSEVARRTGTRFTPMAGHAGLDESYINIQVADDDAIRALPSPTGIWPVDDDPADERHSITIARTGVIVRAAGPVGVARALTTLIQLLATAPGGDAEENAVPCGRILDAPRYAWRGLSLDLSRTFFTVSEVQRVIDLLSLYKLNVLHLHLTDDQAWRLPVGRPGTGARSVDDDFYSQEDLGALVRFAQERYVALVPEVDMPGHAAALMRLNPVLDAGHERRNAWLDPTLPATFTLIEEILAGVAGMFPGSYIHIGGDEPHGMPRDLYTTYVKRARRFVHSIGKRPLGWQESARAGLGPGDVIQYWLTGDTAASRLDLETAAAASVPVIASPLSHCYLDVPYAEPSAEASQAAREGRVGLQRYSPKTVAESFDWEPSQVVGPGHAARVAGVEAAIWAETVSDFDDLTFLLLPRLPGVAEKAWGTLMASDWSRHRDRLADHGRVWSHDDLMYFRASSVDWR